MTEEDHSMTSLAGDTAGDGANDTAGDGANDAVIGEITREIWTSMLGLELQEGTEGILADDGALTGWVEISGAWAGVVALRCTAELARTAAAAMFAVEPAETSTDDVHDAMRELANMIGGNLKALLPEPSLLSLPSVESGLPASIAGDPAARRVELGCDGHPLEVLLARKAAAGDVEHEQGAKR